MAKQVSQDTYNQVVKENMEEFEMSKEEAIEDAIKQFEAQGVDLSNIIKDLSMSGPDTVLLNKTIKKLEDLLKAKSTDVNEFQKELNYLKTESDKSLPHRVAVAEARAYDVILQVLIHFESDEEMTICSLKTMISLMDTQPDLLTPAGVDLMIKYFDTQKNPEVIQYLLKWVKECCIKHELNRQHIYDANILDHLKPLLGDADEATLRAVCAVLRALVLDDDVRVEFGRAHEHARTIASDTLCPIIELLQKFKKDEGVISDLLTTLSTLIVRNEYCKKVEDAGGLNFVIEVMKDFKTNEKLNRQGLKLLKVLAGNDDCKIHIIQKGGARILADSLQNHLASAQTVIFALNAISAISLRSPENSQALFEAGVPNLVVEAMRKHPEDAKIQKTASWAIRNMVSRSRNQCPQWLSLGVEDLLKQALKKFKKECEYDLKAALRDLGCNVELREEWTGKGGKISTQAKLNMPKQ